METSKSRQEEEVFYREAFSRNIGLLSLTEQVKLRNATVAIAGLGGVGGNYCLSLARLGVGNFRIADKDFFEVVNTNRQAGANTETMGQPKVEVMERMIKEINPFAKITTFANGIDSGNVDTFVTGADVVVDGLDFFVIKERRELFAKARERGIFAITSPPIGFGATLLVFDPKGMTFDQYFDINDKLEEKEMLLQFGLGLSPSLVQRSYFRPTSIDFSGKKTPSLGIGTLMCAVLVTCEVEKIILGKKIKSVPYSTQFDPYVQKYKKIYLWKGNRNPMQLLKKIILKKILIKTGKL